MLTEKTTTKTKREVTTYRTRPNVDAYKPSQVSPSSKIDYMLMRKENDEFNQLLGKLELDNETYDEIHSCVWLMMGEMREAAFALGWQVAKHPEMFIFDCGLDDKITW